MKTNHNNLKNRPKKTPAARPSFALAGKKIIEPSHCTTNAALCRSLKTALTLGLNYKANIRYALSLPYFCSLAPQRYRYFNKKK